MATKKARYYDWEMDQVLTEETARDRWRRMQEWGRQHGIREESFNTYAEANFYDLADEIENEAAQAYHDRLGTAEPVKSWDTMLSETI